MGSKRTTTWRSRNNYIVSWLVVRTMTITLISIRLFVDAVDVEPKDFKYVHLWTSQDGETHIKQCEMHNFTRQPYSSQVQQYTRTDFGGLPLKVIFTELPVGYTAPIHPSPAIQFVIVLEGSWYIKTTDDSRYNFERGEVLFQDNVVGSPADKVGQHYSGTVGNLDCKQFIVQINGTAQVDHPCPF